MPDQDLASAWMGFDEGRRKGLLARMSPEQKQNLRKTIEARGTPTPAAPVSTPAEGKGMLATMRDNFASNTQPVPSDGTMTTHLRNFGAAAGRVVGGTPGFVGKLATDAVASVKAGEPSAVMDDLDPMQMVQAPVEQFQQDYKTDKGLAVDNALGTMAGMGVVGAATHGATKIAAKGVDGVKATPGKLRQLARSAAGTSPERVAAAVAEKADTANTQINAAADKNRVTADKHADTVRQVASENEEARGDHALGVEDAKADAAAKHEELKAKEKARVAKSNVADIRKNVEAARKVMQSNKNKLAAYQAEHQQTMRNNAGLDAEDQSRRMHEGEHQAAMAEQVERTKIAEQKGEQARDEKYEAVRQGINGDRQPTQAVQQQVMELRKENPELDKDPLLSRIFRGTTETKYVFDKTSGLPVGPEDEGYDKLYEAENGGESAPMGAGDQKFDRLKSWYGRLGREAYRPNADPTLKRAYLQVRKAVGQSMTDLAERHGQGENLKQGMKMHHDLLETFSDNPNEPQTVAGKTLPSEQVKSDKMNEWLGKVGRYDPEIPKVAGRVRDLNETIKAHRTEDQVRSAKKEVPAPPVPEKFALPERLETYQEPPAPDPKLPKAPDPKERPANPVLESTAPHDVDVNEIKQKLLSKTAQKMGLTGYDAGLFVSSQLLDPLLQMVGAGHMLHGVGRFAGPLYIGGKLLAGKLLENPAVGRFLTAGTAEEAAAIGRIRHADKVRIVNGFQAAVDESVKQGKPIKLSPAVAALLAGAHAQPPQNRKEAMAALGR